MKILFAAHPIAPPWNEGSKNLAYEVARRIKGHSVHILTTKDFTQHGSGVNPVRIYTTSRQDRRSKFQYLSYCLKPTSSFDVVHSFFTPTMLNTRLSRLLAQRAGATPVQTIPCLPQKQYTPSQLKKILFGKPVITISRYTKRQIEKIGILDNTMIRAGVDTNRFSAQQTKPEIIRQKFGITDEPVILYAGEYARMGAIDVIVEALPKVIEKIPKARFIFSCRILRPRDHEVKQHMIEQLKKRDLIQRVTFLAQVDDMPSLLAAADVCWYPVNDMRGKFDTPLVLLESMSVGTPIIVSSEGALAEAVVGESGIVLKDNTAEELTSATVQILNDDQTRLQYSKQSQLAVDAEFNIDQIAQLYSGVYDTIASKKDPKVSVSNYYDDDSETYDQTRFNANPRYYRMLNNAAENILLPYIEKKDVLEIGCGTGIVMDRIRERTHILKGIDVSHGMLERARHKGLDVTHADANEPLPFQDNSFDVVYSFKTISHVKKIEELMVDVSRVTKNGGTIIMEFYNKHSLKWINDIISPLNVYTRFDSMKTIRSYLPPTIMIKKIHGTRIVSVFGVLYKIPVVSSLLNYLEKVLSRTPARRWGGYVTIVGVVKK